MPGSLPPSRSATDFDLDQIADSPKSSSICRQHLVHGEWPRRASVGQVGVDLACVPEADYRSGLAVLRRTL